jgi:chemotaxis protein MotB
MECTTLSRLTTSQVIIFTATFLGLSLIVNIWLFIDHSNISAFSAQQNDDITALKSELETSTQFKVEQLSRIDQMDGNQQELGDFIKDLQVEITLITNEYLKTAQTAKQTKEQLQIAQSQILKLEQSAAQSQRQLKDAQATIANQQRALKTKNDTETFQPNVLVAVNELSSSLPTLDNNIGVSLSALGEGTVHLPIESIFQKGTLEFTNDANEFLGSIASTLIDSQSIIIDVIGHSDSRPIVSDLAKLYPTNWELSAVRASKVVNFLIQKGVSQDRLTASGRAASAPVRDEENAENWAVNRRIEIRLTE